MGADSDDDGRRHGDPNFRSSSAGDAVAVSTDESPLMLPDPPAFSPEPLFQRPVHQHPVSMIDPSRGT